MGGIGGVYLKRAQVGYGAARGKEDGTSRDGCCKVFAFLGVVSVAIGAEGTRFATPFGNDGSAADIDRHMRIRPGAVCAASADGVGVVAGRVGADDTARDGDGLASGRPAFIADGGSVGRARSTAKSSDVSAGYGNRLAPVFVGRSAATADAAGVFTGDCLDGSAFDHNAVDL